MSIISQSSSQEITQRPPAGAAYPATFSLPLIASRVLAVLAYLFPIGDLIAISQGEIARIGHISEASVSKAMIVLIEHGFIWRSEFDREMNHGKGGYWLRLLPLADREGSGADPAPQGSAPDPIATYAESPIPTRQTPDPVRNPGRDQELIPRESVMVLMTHDQIQEEESAHTPLFDRLTSEPRMNWSLATRIAAHPPGTVADFDADLKVAETFANEPFWFAVARWKNGQRVLAPQEPGHERPARSDVPAYQRGRSAAPRRASHNPTGGAELRDPGWAKRLIAAAEAEATALGYADV